MGKLKNLTIVFDDNVDVFSPGDVIKGQVILSIEADTEQGLENVKGIWLRFVGGAKISVSHGNSGQVKDEGYFDTTQILFGTGEGAPDVKNLTVPTGQQVFPFAIRLPEDPLPAAFEEQLGYVRYHVKANVCLIRPIRNKEHRAQRYFSVVGPSVDLNTISGLKTPMVSDITTHGWFGIGPPVATLSLAIPKQGYVSGESVNLTGRIDNRKGKGQFTIAVKLIQEIQFVFTNTISVERVLAKIESKVVCPRGRISNFNVGPLRIPPVPPSGLPGCQLINIEYFILCKDRKFALTIGTVPLRDAGTGRRRVARISAERTRSPSEPPEDVEDDAPPSYEQVVSVTDRIAYEMTKEDFQTEADFLPRYPYFARMGNLAFASNR